MKLAKIHNNESGGGNLLLVFMISILVMTLIGSIAQYSLVFYRQSFRVKESTKMFEVMEQMSKIVRVAYDRNVANNGGLNNPGCPGGTSEQTIIANGKTTYLCFDNTLADRCIADPSDPGNANTPFCILNFDGANEVVDYSKENELQFHVQLNDEIPALARFGRFLDRKLDALGFPGDQPEQRNPFDGITPGISKAHAQARIEEVYIPDAPNSAMTIVTPNCVVGDSINFHDNLCVVCAQPLAGDDQRDNVDTTVNATADLPAGPAGANSASARCVTFKVCALWAVDDPANPGACAANGYWYQKIAIISHENFR